MRERTATPTQHGTPVSWQAPLLLRIAVGQQPHRQRLGKRARKLNARCGRRHITTFHTQFHGIAAWRYLPLLISRMHITIPPADSNEGLGMMVARKCCVMDNESLARPHA